MALLQVCRSAEELESLLASLVCGEAPAQFQRPNSAVLNPACGCRLSGVFPCVVLQSTAVRFLCFSGLYRDPTVFSQIALRLSFLMMDARAAGTQPGDHLAFQSPSPFLAGMDVLQAGDATGELEGPQDFKNGLCTSCL